MKPTAFLGDAVCCLTYCDLAVNVLCKLITVMVSGSVVQYSHGCRMLKLCARLTFVEIKWGWGQTLWECVGWGHTLQGQDWGGIEMGMVCAGNEWGWK